MVAAGERRGKLLLVEPVLVQTNRQRETQWRVRCDCGREYVARIHNLRKQKSCGCATRSLWPLPLRERLRQHKTREVQRGGQFGLSDEEAFRMFTSECSYCGEKGTAERPLGIDRLDSSVGYILGNCAPSCGPCNKMKLRMSIEQFRKHIERVYKWLQSH